MGLWLAKPTDAQAPTIKSEDYQSGNLIIKDNAIIRPILDRQEMSGVSESSSPNNVGNKGSNPTTTITTTGAYNGWHSTRSEKKISVESLQAYLSKSPLAPYSAQILESDYWATIIGICTIEQYGCTKAPYNNYWGIMSSGSGLQHFNSIPESISAISSLLSRYESKGKDTLEELNGYYVVPASQNWFNTVLKTKLTLEQYE